MRGSFKNRGKKKNTSCIPYLKTNLEKSRGSCTEHVLHVAQVGIHFLLTTARVHYL